MTAFVGNHKNRVVTVPLRAALTVVAVTAVVAGSVLQGIGYVSNRGIERLGA